MATALPPESSPASRGGRPSDSGGKLIEYDQFIDRQLRKTRQQVRTVDFASGLMTLAAGGLSFFLVVVLFDHWLVSGGLGFTGRLIALLIILTGSLAYAWHDLLPLAIRRINPVFAAQAIERSKPSLKNSLVNFLLFRANPAGLTQNVYYALEEQAATNLAKVPVDATIDRSKLVKTGYVLLAVLVVGAAYKVLSPKDPLRTIGRVILPWGDIAPPTRVKLIRVEPGDAVVFRGQQIKVSAEVRGLAAHDHVVLRYSTADGQVADQSLTMELPADGYRHECQLPPDRAGLQQDLEYRVFAGDASSKPFHLTVQAAPTIVVESIDYDYPSYTGLLKTHVERQADIKAIEGTEVTIVAVANQDIKAAGVDFACDGSDDLRMRVEGQRATATFRLVLEADRKTPEHTSYQIRFTNLSGQPNPEPIRQQIEVTPDVAPEIQFLAPKQEEVALGVQGTLACELSANDPDYALRHVTLMATVGGRKLLEQSLLDEEWRGQFSKQVRVKLKSLGLKEGDVVDYWAVAIDNKVPDPNRTETAHRRVRIVSSREQDAPDQVAQADDPQAPGDDNAPEQPRRPGDKNDERPSKPDKQPAEGDRNDAQPSDPGEQKGDQQPSEKGGDASAGGRQQNGAGKSAQQGGNQQGDSKSPAEQQNAAQGQKAGEQQPGGKVAEKQEPVARDGSQDGEAFDKILERQQEQQPKDQQQGKGSEPPKSEQQPEPQDKQSKQPDKNQQQSGQKQGKQPDQQPGDQKGQEQKEQKGDDQARQQGDKEKQQQGGEKGGQQSGGDNKGQQQQQKSGGQQGTPKRGQPPQQGGSEQGDSQQGDQPSGDSSGSNQASRSKGQPGKQDNAGNQSSTADDSGVEQPEGNQPADPPGGKTGKGKPTGRSQKQPGKSQEGVRREPASQGSSADTEHKLSDTDQSPGDQQQAPDAQDKSGEGDRQQGPAQQGNKQQPSKDRQLPNARGGGQDDKGQSGTGSSTNDDNKGSPAPQDNNRQNNHKQNAKEGGNDPTNHETPASPSHSEKQSDSQGAQEGDRSGGGRRGGGQKANKPGTGGGGQNTAADEGSGAAQSHGEGATSDKAGSDQEAQGQTGQAGERQGAGSQSRAKPTGQGGQQQNAAGGANQSQQNGDPNNVVREPGASGAGAAGPPQGTGDPADPTAPAPPAEAAPADDPNLQYARKATDLALERLKQQLDKGETDQELLDRLGWTRQELDDFVRRWQQMKWKAQSAGAPGQNGRQELDDTLRSLGLRPRGADLRGKAARDDQSHGLKEGRRTSPPAEYLEQYRAYTRGTSRAPSSK